MSSRKTGTVKEKRSIGSGILGLVRKKSKLNRSRSPLEHHRASGSPVETAEVSSTESFTETIEFKPDYFAVEEEGQLLQDLTDQLQEAQTSLVAAQSKTQEDQEAIDDLQIRLKEIEENNCSVQNTLKEMAEDTQAEVVILKQQIENLHQELQKKQDLNSKVQRLTDEVTDLQTQNQELRFQQERSSTRSRINGINEEKFTKEEILRLQKELRMAERNMKIEISGFEAQLKAAQDGNERLQEKVKISRLRYDEMDKEKLDLKIEINRLQKKLEKTGSYAELKRIQTEQESVELEVRNLKRKNTKLERQLKMASNSNEVMNGHDSNLSDIPYSSRSSQSDSKTTPLEKEINELEAAVTKLRSENKKLEEKAGNSQQTSEVLSLKVKQLDEQLQAERSKVQEMEVSFGELKKAAAGSAGEEYLDGILKQMESLKQASKDVETKFKVKEKDLWSTIEAQKKQIEDIEMEKLALELGEEIGGSDTEERESTPKPVPQSSEKVAELQADLDVLRKSKAKIEQDLQEAMQKLEEASKTEQDLQEAMQKLEEASKTEQDLQEAMQKLEEASRDTSFLEKHKADIDAQQREIAELQQANERLQKALEEGVVRSKGLEESSKKLKTVNDDLSKNLEESATTAKQVPALTSEVKKLTQRVTELQKPAAKGDGKKVSFDEISVLKKDVDKLTNLNARLTKDLEAAEDEIDHREDTNAKLTEETDKLRKEKQKLKADLELAEEELEKMDAELIEQTGELSGKIAQLKKDNSDIRASAAGRRESTPRPRETTPPRKTKEQADGPSKKAQSIAARKTSSEAKENTSSPIKLAVADKLKSPPPSADKPVVSPPAVKSRGVKGKSPTPPPNLKQKNKDSPKAPAVVTKTKKVVVVGGVKLPMPPPAKAQEEELGTPPPESKAEETELPNTDVGDIHTAPSLTPSFKKPPPAPKKKPSRNSLRKNAEESQKQN